HTPPPSHISTLSLHDALPISPSAAEWVMRHFGEYIRVFGVVPCRSGHATPAYDRSKSEFLEWWGRGDILVDDSAQNIADAERVRSEEHTSELQSRGHLVCRLL